MKKFLLIIPFLASAFLFLSFNTSAKSASLPSSITHHQWYRTTDGSQGGYHDKSTFHGNSLTYYGYRKFVSGDFAKKTNVTWNFSNIKKANSKNYYATINSKYPVKIRLISKKTFWIVPKHTMGNKGNYTGNDKYGASIFKLAK